MEDTKTHVVDITPTWEAIVPIMLTVLENGDNDAKVAIRKEIYKMARIADKYNESQKDLAD